MRNRIILAFLFAGTACSTAPTAGEQRITVNTLPVSARCILENNLGGWEVGSTPATAVVKRSFSPLTLRCEAPNYTAATSTIPAQKREKSANTTFEYEPSFLDIGNGMAYEYVSDNITLTLKK